MLSKHEFAVSKLDVGLGHLWINVVENVFQELGCFLVVVIQHLGSDVSIFYVDGFFIFDVGEALRRESVEAVVKEEVGEAKIQVIEFVLR